MQLTFMNLGMIYSKGRDCRLKFAGEHLIALLECSRRALEEQFKEFTIEHRARVVEYGELKMTLLHQIQGECRRAIALLPLKGSPCIGAGEGIHLNYFCHSIDFLAYHR